jgi:hypothetical protein
VNGGAQLTLCFVLKIPACQEAPEYSHPDLPSALFCAWSHDRDSWSLLEHLSAERCSRCVLRVEEIKLWCGRCLLHHLVFVRFVFHRLTFTIWCR